MMQNTIQRTPPSRMPNIWNAIHARMAGMPKETKAMTNTTNRKPPMVALILNCLLAYMGIVALCAEANAQRAPDVAVSGVSALPVACKAGTGSAITSVTASAGGTLVCSAATSYRTWWRIANNNASGGATIYCTDDGTTPTTSSWDFVVYAQNWTVSSGSGVVSPGALKCISGTGSSTITAAAVQAGAP